MNKEEVLKRMQMGWDRRSTNIEISEIQNIDSKIKKYGINWSAIGVVTLEEAREFSNNLNECMSLVNQMNQLSLSTKQEKVKIE